MWGIETINYRASLFYRYDVIEKTNSREEFLKTLTDGVPILLKHGFLEKSQAAYSRKIKDTIGEKAFLVFLDFAKNYTERNSRL